MTQHAPATAPERPTDSYVPAEIYVRVQQFYAGQMHLLDGIGADPVAWSRTFTEDAEFSSALQGEPDVGRAAILESVRQGLGHIHAEGPVDFRHWFGMIDVTEAADGGLRTRYYALAFSTARGGPLRVRGHMLCRDHLVWDGDRLLVRRRHLEADGFRAGAEE